MMRNLRDTIKTIFPILIFAVLVSFCFSTGSNAAGVETKVQALKNGMTCQVTGYYEVTSSKESVAEVTKTEEKDYIVTAKKRGKTTLGCYNKNGTLKAKIYLLVTTDQSFVFDNSSIILKKGKTQKVTASTDFTSGVIIKYSSSNKKIATVNKTGKIKAVAPGSATIRASFYYKNIRVKTIKKVVNVYSCSYDTTTLTLTKGDTKKVKASVSKGCTVKYSSSDKNIAKVNKNGKITAVDAGTAFLTVQVYYGDKIVQTKDKIVNVKTKKKSSSSSGNSWTVTQYGRSTGSSEMFYTITSDDGLIIIDGGVSSEEKRLRTIIAEHGNKVTAWILTHAHPDHITAFMNIYKKPKGIKIKKIYTVEPTDKNSLKASGETSAHIKVWEKFTKMSIPELRYVHTGEQWETLGLKFEVLSAYSSDIRDKVLKQGSGNLLNNGSMVFRVSGARDSMLFCADVGSEMTDDLVSRYGERLKSDFVQMSHHAKGGLKSEFYELVNPKGAFFDCSTSDSALSNVKKNKELIRSIGGKIFTYETSPNQIVLK